MIVHTECLIRISEVVESPSLMTLIRVSLPSATMVAETIAER